MLENWHFKTTTKQSEMGRKVIYELVDKCVTTLLLRLLLRESNSIYTHYSVQFGIHSNTHQMLIAKVTLEKFQRDTKKRKLNDAYNEITKTKLFANPFTFISVQH